MIKSPRYWCTLMCGTLCVIKGYWSPHKSKYKQTNQRREDIQQIQIEKKKMTKCNREKYV